MWLVYAILGAFTTSFVTIFTKIGLINLSPSLSATIKAIIMAIFLLGVSIFSFNQVYLGLYHGFL